MENYRAITEKIERDTLSPHACLSQNSRGRDVPIDEGNLRTCFQRDRDRIIHCASFRRMKHKTQVFLIPKSEHYRTRLTHTLEVSQIARTVSRALRLNEDLTEAIALGHDLGHTPFGHDGERALNTLVPGGFAHNEQSLRVVEIIERDGKGLNLTKEVRDGILNHQTHSPAALTREAAVVRYCDKIAYINHDIEDSIRAGIIKESDLPAEPVKILGRTKSARITTLVSALIESGADTSIGYPDEIKKAHDELRKYMFGAVYHSVHTSPEKAKASRVVEFLFGHYLENISQMPELYQKLADNCGKERAVADFISGMTDDYAVDLFKDIFVPRSW